MWLGEKLVFTAMLLFASHPVHTEAVSDTTCTSWNKIDKYVYIYIFT